MLHEYPPPVATAKDIKNVISFSLSVTMMFFILTILAAATTSLAQEPELAEEIKPLVGGDNLSGAEDVASEIDLADNEKTYAEYLKACSTLGIQPISIGSGSYTQPGMLLGTH
jgi:hypothetical protein